MNWWQKLYSNILARWGAVFLFLLYLLVGLADFAAPNDPYASQVNGALLPPTPVYWRDQSGAFVGPHVYPTTLGPVDLNTGDRALRVNRQASSPIRFLVQDWPYDFLQIRLPLPTQLSLNEPNFDEVVVFPGFPSNLHLFGTVGPGKLNLLGTDEKGRDQFSRLLFGGRISLSIGLVGIAISFPLGMLMGGIAGYFGGGVDALMMRLTEVLMTIPTIYLLVALAAVLPSGLGSTERFLLIVLITSFVSWAGLARVIRGQVLSIKERNFVQAVRAMGGHPLYILIRHVLPQTATYIIISATLAIPGFIVAESVLSLIGLGIKEPDPSWGNMLSIATNASVLVLQPWLIWPSAIILILTVLAFNLLGDGLRDALDPRTTER
jgi:peptide/nickel transport system permease protein